MEKKFYHTQESRDHRLVEPIPCTRDDAWLGNANYFWYEEVDADHWGNTSKRTTGYYEVYISDIDCENVLDTVFNEEQYYFWYKQIEKTAQVFIKEAGIKPSIKELNGYFKERAIWDEVDGIMFQDLPSNSKRLLVKPVKKGRTVFAYRKRIQLAVYNTEIIVNFAFHKRAKCS